MKYSRAVETQAFRVPCQVHFTPGRSGGPHVSAAVSNAVLNVGHALQCVCVFLQINIRNWNCWFTRGLDCFRGTLHSAFPGLHQEDSHQHVSLVSLVAAIPRVLGDLGCLIPISLMVSVAEQLFMGPSAVCISLEKGRFRSWIHLLN